MRFTTELAHAILQGSKRDSVQHAFACAVYRKLPCDCGACPKVRWEKQVEAERPQRGEYTG